jgi:hypothetical protein
MKQTGKALLAWDEWGKNPARAAGAVTFNVLTTVFTGGEGAAAAGAGKAGAVAKALSVAGKAGRIIDPMTYVAKGAGAGLSKIGDIAKGLKGIGKIDIPDLPDNAITLPEGTVKLPDGTIHLPEGAAIPQGATKLPNGSIELPHDTPALPEGTTKLPSVDGSPAHYLDPHGNLLDHQGNIIQHADQAPREPGGGDLTGRHDGADTPHTPTPVKQPALVGATTHTADQTAHAGDHIRLGDSTGHDLGDTGRTGDHAPVHAGGETVPTVHAGGDGLPGGGHVNDHLPGGHTGDHLPGGSAHEHGASPSANDETPRNESGGHHADGHGGGAEGDPGQEARHDGHAAPPHDGSAGGAGEGPGGDRGSAGAVHGGPGNGHEPPRVDYSEGHERPSDPTGRMQPEQKAAVAEELARLRMAPQDIEKCLTGLGKSEYGAGIAKYIADGHLADLPGYEDLLSQCKQVSKHSDMTPAVYMALEHAMDLRTHGVDGLAFEWKVPDEGLDLDVLVRSGDRIEYGVQLKDVDSVSGLNSATRGIAEKQLIGTIAGQKVAILDVHDSKAALTDKILGRIAGRARMTNATFVLRFEDGSITIPANGPTYP